MVTDTNKDNVNCDSNSVYNNIYLIQLIVIN